VVHACSSAFRFSLYSFAAIACAVLGLSTVAQAQTLPAVSATPPPTAKHVHKRAKRALISHLPILDIVPIFTQPAPFETAAQTKGYDPLDVGGSIKFPLTPKLSFGFDRIVGSIFDQASERVLINGVAVYPSLLRDEILVERLDYQLTPQVVLEGGLAFRHREEGTGVSGAPFPYTVSSSEAHDGYLSATYTTVPIRALGESRFLFSIEAEDQPVDHHVAELNSATNTVYYIDENPHQNEDLETTQQVGVIIPIDPRHGFSGTVREAWGAINFYENAPFPYRWASATTYALTKKFSNTFSLTARVESSSYIEQGYPFPKPNALQSGTIDILGDFHFDLGALGHH
jgi:hypothetical protein